jgi:hypothetical protein
MFIRDVEVSNDTGGHGDKVKRGGQLRGGGGVGSWAGARGISLVKLTADDSPFNEVMVKSALLRAAFADRAGISFGRQPKG